jgi:hypothetical protein
VSEAEPSIEPDEILWRRIHPDKWIFDKNLNRYRPTSENFKDRRRDEHLSSYIAREVPGGKERLLQGHPNYGLAEYKVSDALAFNLQVVREPDEIPGHVEVRGKKDRFAPRVAEECRVLVWSNPLPAQPG